MDPRLHQPAPDSDETTYREGETMTDARNRDTVPPPPLGGVHVPAVAAFADEPGPGATDRAWALYFAKLAREMAGRPVTLVIQKVLLIAIAIALSIHIGDDVIDAVFKLRRLAEPTHQVVCVPEPAHS